MCWNFPMVPLPPLGGGKDNDDMVPALVIGTSSLIVGTQAAAALLK